MEGGPEYVADDHWGEWSGILRGPAEGGGCGNETGTPVDLLIRTGETFKTIRIDYRGGHRYPRIERITGKPAYIDDILAAR